MKIPAFVKMRDERISCFFAKQTTSRDWVEFDLGNQISLYGIKIMEFAKKTINCAQNGKYQTRFFEIFLEKNELL